MIDRLASWLNLQSACIGAPQSGTSVQFAGQPLLEGEIYLVIPTGAVWLRFDGGVVVSRTPPARLFAGPGLVLGQGVLPSGITDDTVATTQGVGIEGPLDAGFAYRLLTGENPCA